MKSNEYILEDLAEARAALVGNDTKTALFLIDGLMKSVRESIAAAQDRANGNAERRAAAKRILKRSSGRAEWLQHSIRNGGQQILCDGYMAVRTIDPIDLCEEPGLDDEYHFRSMQNIIKGAYDKSLGSVQGIRATVAELKCAKAEKKETSGRYVVYRVGGTAIDINLAIDTCTILGGACRFTEAGKRQVYVEGDLGDAIILALI